jgi:mono/diheme cytochrome c family protein
MSAVTHRIAIAVLLAPLPFLFSQGRTESANDAQRVINQYCVGCHSNRAKTGGLSLEGADYDQIPAHGDMWEKVVKKLRSGTMPPANSPRPDLKTYNATAASIEARLDEAPPYAGRPVIHRLNRAEYANAIRDLLDLRVDVNALLPPDDAAFGFDNISEMLGVSPALQERYLGAALKIAAIAIGDPAQPATSYTWRIPQDLTQDQPIEGLPLGTVGGTSAVYNFPLNAIYRLSAKLYRTNLNIMRGLQTAHPVEFAIDGKRVYSATIGGSEDLAALFEAPTDTGDKVDARLQVEVPVTAGPHTLSVAFVQNSQFAEPVRLQSFERSSVDNFDWAGHPHLQQLTVAGPFKPTGAGETPSRKRIFLCAQTTDACARQIVTTLVRRAYRQPPASADVNRAMEFYTNARKTGNFDRGIQAALERILASPKFLFRAEPDAPGPVSNSVLASRLSFFLWSRIPDDGPLDVRRMLADPKAHALVDNFAGQWLQLRNLRNFQPNTDIFPDFDDNLRQGFRRETEMLFESIIQEDRSVLDLLTADYTFVNERLARHYGIPGIYGSRFRRVKITDEARKGLLGQGSILVLTSHAERTSPVVRGKWILENLLGQQVPPPPADVPPLPEKKDGDKPKTMREQMALHRVNPVCAACHKTLDPIGFAMENFNAVGAWRSEEAGGPIDTSGELSDGTKVNGVVELRKALLTRPENFVTTFTEKLLTYALGRGLDTRDMPTVRAIVRDAAKDNYRFSSIVLGITRSTPFRNSAAEVQNK